MIAERARLLVAAMDRVQTRAGHFTTLGGQGSGNFAHEGRPGEVGGSSSSGLNALLGRVRQPDSGFTYHAVTGTEPKTGFVLSMHPDREKVLDVSALTFDDLVDYTVVNADLLKQPENYLGGWHDPQSGQLYLDISTVVDKAEDAARLGQAHGQKAYFDLRAGRSIPIVKAASIRRAYEDWQAQRHGIVPDRFDRRADADAHIGRSGTALSEGDGTDADRGRAIARARTARIREAAALTTLGGSGSGNFAHAGRPGEVGGSSRLNTKLTDSFARTRKTSPIVTERERYHKLAGTEYRARPVPLYHSTTQTFEGDKPNFDAFYGTEEFQKTYPQEFGPNTYEVVLPPDASILDLNQPSQAATNFMTRAQLVAWPNEKPRTLHPSDPDFYDNWYEVWTDKDNLIAALKTFPYQGVKYNDEYLLPATTIKSLPARKYAPHQRAAESKHSDDAELISVLADAILAQNTDVIEAIIGLDPRTLGGQGSGNFGHAGRPGEVGGSASGTSQHEAAVPFTPIAPTTGTTDTDTLGGGVPIQSFRDQLHAKGWRTAEVKDLPKDIRQKIRTDLGLRQQNALSVTPATVSPVVLEGVKQGLDDLEAKMPDLAAIMKTEVPILVAEYNPDVTATSIIGGSEKPYTDRDKWMLINTALPAAGQNLGTQSFNISQRIAGKAGLTGDDFMRETYRNTMLHETGHILDALVDHKMTRDTVATLMEHHEDPYEMIGTLRRSVSDYAAHSGPMEASAEIFTAAVRGYKLPKALHDLRDRMLATNLKKRVRR